MAIDWTRFIEQNTEARPSDKPEVKVDNFHQFYFRESQSIWLAELVQLYINSLPGENERGNKTKIQYAKGIQAKLAKPIKFKLAKLVKSTKKVSK